MCNTRPKPYSAETEFWNGEFWMDARYVCRHCQEEHEAAGSNFAWADERTSFGCYAGKYCDACWKESGFRDATDADAEFLPDDCGEVIYEDQY
jgi:hypothetical protein